MNFKQFLQELAFNKRAFSKVEKRLGSDAKVGFEFEMWLPESSTFFTAGEDRDAVRLSTLDDPAEVQQFFDVDRRFGHHIEMEYDEWLLKVRNQFIEDHWHLHYDDDVAAEEGDDYAKSEARAAAENDFNEGDYTFKDFVDDEYRTWRRFIDLNTDGPRFGWARDTGDDRATFFTSQEDVERAARGPTVRSMLDSLRRELNIDVREGNVSRVDFGRGTWVATEDGSIEPTDGKTGVGIELVSPPLPLEAALRAADRVFGWMQRHGVVTNKTTGLHVNISVPNIDDIDKLKLVLLMGDRYVLQVFNRFGNTFTIPHFNRLVQSIKVNGPAPKELQQMRELAGRSIDNDKYRTVNFGKLEDGYLEFRAPGGADYHERFEEVRDTVLRYAAALEAACDPEKEKNEYIKKLSLLIDKSIRASNEVDLSDKDIYWIVKHYSTTYAAKLIELLERLEANRIERPSALKMADIFIELFDAAQRAFDRHPISRRQLVQLRIRMKRLGVTMDDLQEALQASTLKDAQHVVDMVAAVRSAIRK